MTDDKPDFAPGDISPVEAYRRMSYLRRFEETCLDLSKSGHVAGSIHLCIGQEAVPVGAASVLEPEDLVIATYRGHGWAIAKGSSPGDVLAEVLQRADGLNGGRAGSPLLSDPDRGFLGETSIVGAGSPIATGVALAQARRDTGHIAVVSFGDGAMNQGATNEGMYFAAALALPVVFVCENNGWSEMTPTSEMIRGDLVGRAAATGIAAHVVDGNDAFAVARAVREAAAACRRGEGPVFLDCRTVRLSGHYNGDIEHYRASDDRNDAQRLEPLHALVQSGAVDADAAAAIDRTYEVAIADLAETVLAGPEPDPGTVDDHVYGTSGEATPTTVSAGSETMTITYQDAINRALADELELRPDMVVYGEDVGRAGGIFGVTRKLQRRYGAERVFDTPIAESAILGSAVGSAMAGLRPVVEIMWADFLFVALDQIINQAANIRYVNRSRLSAPMTIRTQQGVTPGSCAQHSQSVEAILAHIPGIKVGLISTPQDAYTMTRAAIADPDPTVLIESRALYRTTGTVVTGGTSEPVGGAVRRREGTDICAITWGGSVARTLEAADILESNGISAAVLDLRWLRPLDEDAIVQSILAAGGRAAVVEEASTFAGFGAEVAARANELLRGRLAAPVMRIGTREVRIPSAPILQNAAIPTTTRIVEYLAESLGRSI